MRRAELFPTDRALVVRMVLAATIAPLVVAAGLVILARAAPGNIQAAVALAILVGVIVAVRERRKRRAPTELAVAAAPELHAAVERLCLAADIPKPRLVLEHERQPNSWVVSLGRGHSQLHVTKGLLETLEGAELEAVVAHELAHIAQRDAAVMTVVGGPAAVLLSGGRELATTGGWWPIQIGGLVALAIGWVGSLGTRILSRHRELSADAGAVALTGNPSALASALVKVSDGLVAIPKADLRVAAARDAFHLVPASRGKSWLPATHPPLQARIARLERLEARLQSARPAVRHEGAEPLH